MNHPETRIQNVQNHKFKTIFWYSKVPPGPEAYILNKLYELVDGLLKLNSLQSLSMFPLTWIKSERFYKIYAQWDWKQFVWEEDRAVNLALNIKNLGLSYSNILETSLSIFQYTSPESVFKLTIYSLYDYDLFPYIQIHQCVTTFY